MGLFSGIEKAELFERGQFLMPGFCGELEVKRTLAKETLKVGVAFIVEFEVKTSNLNEHPVGAKVTWFQKMADKTVAFPAIKAFIAALSGYEVYQKDQIESEVSPNLQRLLDEAIATPDKNDFVGCRILVQTESVKTQKGLDFTRHAWSPASA